MIVFNYKKPCTETIQHPVYTHPAKTGEVKCFTNFPIPHLDHFLCAKILPRGFIPLIQKERLQSESEQLTEKTVEKTVESTVFGRFTSYIKVTWCTRSVYICNITCSIRIQ